MLLGFIIAATITTLTSLFIFKITRSILEDIDTKEKEHELEEIHEQYEHLKDVDVKEVQKERKTIKKVLDS